MKFNRQDSNNGYVFYYSDCGRYRITERVNEEDAPEFWVDFLKGGSWDVDSIWECLLCCECSEYVTERFEDAVKTCEEHEQEKFLEKI